MEPDPDSVRIMQDIDAMSSAERALVREYGYVIVRGMIADGYNDTAELASILAVWRRRRQDQWLATQYVTSKTLASIVNAAMFRAAKQRQ